MLALAEKTGNDIRSCLGMLQFFGGSDKPLTLIDVLRSNVGKKDIHQGLFGVWQAIFQVINLILKNIPTILNNLFLGSTPPQNNHRLH